MKQAVYPMARVLASVERLRQRLRGSAGSVSLAVLGFKLMVMAAVAIRAPATPGVATGYGEADREDGCGDEEGADVLHWIFLLVAGLSVIVRDLGP